MSYEYKSAYPECKGKKFTLRDLKKLTPSLKIHTLHTDEGGHYRRDKVTITNVDLPCPAINYCLVGKNNLNIINYSELSENGDFGNLQWFTEGVESSEYGPITTER